MIALKIFSAHRKRPDKLSLQVKMPNEPSTNIVDIMTQLQYGKRFLGHHYYILSLSGLCPEKEKKSFKEIHVHQF